MLAQVGLDAVVNSALNLILSPIVLIWFAAASYLMLLLFFGLFVACVRAWNRYFVSINDRHHSDQGES